MKDIEIMDSENTLKEEIAEPECKSPEEKNKKKNAVRKTVKKAVAVGVGTGLLTVGAVAALDNLPTHGTGISQITDPDPVVLEIDEADMAGENDVDAARLVTAVVEVAHSVEGESVGVGRVGIAANDAVGSLEGHVKEAAHTLAGLEADGLQLLALAGTVDLEGLVGKCRRAHQPFEDG